MRALLGGLTGRLDAVAAAARSTRRLLIDLISTMNASFPDHDFSGLRPEQFTREPSMDRVSGRDVFPLCPIKDLPR